MHRALIPWDRFNLAVLFKLQMSLPWMTNPQEFEKVMNTFFDRFSQALNDR